MTTEPTPTDWETYQTPTSSVMRLFQYSASSCQLRVTFKPRKENEPPKHWVYSDVDLSIFTEMKRRVWAKESVGSYFQKIKKTLKGAEDKS